MKRANGTGSVYKMKHKALRKPYRAVVTLGYGPDGKAHRKALGSFATQKEAYQALARYEPAEAKKALTFGACLDLRIKNAEREGLSEARIRQYGKLKKIFAQLADRPMRDIRASDVQAFFDDSGMAQATLKNRKGLFTSIGALAVKLDAIPRNYFSDIVISKHARPVRAMHIYTPEEIRAIWAHRDSDTAKMTLIYIYTGARLRELTGMPLSDVHIADRYMVGGEKTKAGKNRVIPIADCVLPFADYLYTRSAEKGSPYLFGGVSGFAYYKRLRTFLANLGLPKHHPHESRHTFISMCSNAGVDPVLIKRIVGHAGADITESIYTHKNTQQYIEAVNRLPVYWLSNG